jgi:hypothetical protein
VNHALAKPAVLTIVILVIVTAGGLLLRSNTGSAKPPPPIDADEPSAKHQESRIEPNIPQTSAAAKAAEPPRASEPARTRESSKTAVGPKIAGPENAGQPRQLLETVGTLTAAHCYLSYVNLGLLSDGKAKGIYTEKEASHLLDSVLSVLDTVDGKLAALGKTDLDREDRESLDRMRDLSDLLRRQGSQLQTFWDSGKETDAAKYEEIRKDSWAAISGLMGTGR